MRGLVVWTIIFAAFTTDLYAKEYRTFDAVLAGKKCKISEIPSEIMEIECTYTVGSDLRFAIAGIGQTGTGISFQKSNMEGDFYASFGLMHGCVIIQPGGNAIKSTDYVSLFDMAFVSPKNGKVYKDWIECKAGQ